MASLSLPVPTLALSYLVALTLLTPGCESGDASAGGPLAVEAPLVDFGRVFEGGILEHEWELAVRRPVSLRALKTDCGCTLARIERGGPSGRVPYELEQPLAAGEALFVSAAYDTRGRRGPAARAVTLSTTSGEILALTLAADVQPWLRVEPREFEFARVSEGETAERAFEVRAEAGEAFGLSASGRALAPWVKVLLEPVEPAGTGRARLWKGRVLLAGDAPIGTFSYPIELISDVPVAPAERAGPVTVGARADAARTHSASPSWTLQVVGVVVLSAPTLEFGLVHAHETVARSVRVESLRPDFVPDAVAARLEPLRPDEPFYLARTAEVRTRLVGHTCEIELTLAGLDPGVSGNFLARLVVETGHPELPRLEALVRGVRAPDGAPGR